MLLAGDEFGHTQQGNNNAYAQDNEITWLDWQGISSQGRELLNFTHAAIAIRKSYPILYRGRFLIGQHNEDLDVKDVTWLTPAATEMEAAQWEDTTAKCFGMMLDGRAQPTGIKRRGSDATLLLVFNAHEDVVKFTLPDVPDGAHWTRLVDTNDPAPVKDETFAFGEQYDVTGRSFLLFVLSVDREYRRRLDSEFLGEERV